MRRAVSVSLGSPERDKAVVVRLLGEEVSLERVGTDGDLERAAAVFAGLDGSVEAFGVGGADLGLQVAERWYPLHSVRRMVRHVRRTPLVDGTGLKLTLERTVAAFLERSLGAHLDRYGRRVGIMTGADRWGLTAGFSEAGYECAFGDLAFSLGVPVILRTPGQLEALASLLMPVVGRVPLRWVYPVGARQLERRPRQAGFFARATVIAGDCHYIRRYAPDDLAGKVVVTNTTTAADVAFFSERGAAYLVTVTPVLDGRSFGANAMEAALVAASGKGRPLSPGELGEMLASLGMEPTLRRLEGGAAPGP